MKTTWTMRFNLSRLYGGFATDGGSAVSEAKERSVLRSGAKADPPVVVDARLLFRGRREIVIEHAGVRYRLRITRRNKLRLQK